MSLNLPDDPILVSPDRACQLLGIGKTMLFGLLQQEDGPFESVKIGNARRITMASVRRVAANGAAIKAQLASAPGGETDRQLRGPGRPRKTAPARLTTTGAAGGTRSTNETAPVAYPWSGINCGLYLGRHPPPPVPQV
jgi:hypothetical protein